jgi:hypothetical protein
MTLMIGVCSAATDPAAEATDLWDVQIGLPLWASGLEGEIGVRNRSVHVDEDFDDIFDTVDFLVPVNLEVRYCHHWLFFANMLYVETTTDAEPGRLIGGAVDEVRLKQKEFDADFGVGYNLFPHRAVRLEPFVGGRVTSVDAELSLAVPGDNPEFDDSKAWVDPIVGFMFKFPAGRTFALFAEADIGGFGVSSDLTWQVNAGGELSLGKHFYSRLTYRHLETDYEDDGFVYDIKTSGPQLEFGFRF